MTLLAWLFMVTGAAIVYRVAGAADLSIGGVATLSATVGLWVAVNTSSPLVAALAASSVSVAVSWTLFSIASALRTGIMAVSVAVQFCSFGLALMVLGLLHAEGVSSTSYFIPLGHPLRSSMVNSVAVAGSTTAAIAFCGVVWFARTRSGCASIVAVRMGPRALEVGLRPYHAQRAVGTAGASLIGGGAFLAALHDGGLATNRFSTLLLWVFAGLVWGSVVIELTERLLARTRGTNRVSVILARVVTSLRISSLGRELAIGFIGGTSVATAIRLSASAASTSVHPTTLVGLGLFASLAFAAVLRLPQSDRGEDVFKFW